MKKYKDTEPHPKQRTMSCIACKGAMYSSQKTKKYCSYQCKKNYRIRFDSRPFKNGISAGTMGAITELKISAKLMDDGYSVFRALSPSCFCDLIAIKNGEVKYIEARTGYRNKAGNVTYSKICSSNGGSPNYIAVYVPKEDLLEIIKI